MTALTFEPLDAPLGALVSGFTPTDLADDAPLPVEELSRALETHGVLVFRGHAIPAERFVALGMAFGELEVLPEPDKRHPDHPEIFNLSNLGPDGEIVTFDDPQSVFLRGTQRWHTDSSFRRVPCLCTMLNAIEVPDSGGETEFADMSAVFESLPDDRKAELIGLTAVHSYAYSRANNPGKMDPMSEEERAKYPPVGHPLVRRHRDGRRSLYLGGHASHILEMDERAGRELLEELVGLAEQDRFVYRHRWQENDLVVWDNRTMLHRLLPYDIANERRVMQRLTVAGTEAVEPAVS